MFLSNGTPVTGPIGTLGDATPLFSTANYYARNALPLSREWAAYAGLYRTQLWVGVVVRKLAYSQARLPLQLGTEDNGIWQAAPGSPAEALLRKPNPQMNGFKLKLWTSATRRIYGEAFWLKLRDLDGRVRELHPMHPVNTIVHREDDGSLTYLYTAGIRQVGILPPIPARDVVAFTSYNPDNLIRGLSSLEGLRQTLLNEDAARRAMQSFWTRGARPSVALVHPSTLSQAAQDRLKARFDSDHAGADHFGGTAVFEEGLVPHILQLNMEEMQYIESRKLDREEVCAAFDVPPPVVHILDHATYSNITEQMRSQYRDTMAPILEEDEAVIDDQLLAVDFPGSPDRCKFNMDHVLRGDFETRSTAVTGLVVSGVMKPDEGRPMVGLPKVGGEADRLYANQAMQPLGTVVRGAQPADALPPTQATERPALLSGPGMVPAGDRRAAAAAALREISALPAVRSILGRVSRCKSLADLRGTLVAEHAAVLAPYFTQQRAAVLATVGAKSIMGSPKDPVSGASTGPFDAAAWNQQLAALLQALAAATAKASGGKVAGQLGAGFDVSQMAEWIRDNAAEAARRINAATLGQLATELATDQDPADAVAHVYDQLATAQAHGEPASTTEAPGVVLAGTVLAGSILGARLVQIARTRVQTVAQSAGHNAAAQAGATHKTWDTGDNPRSTHAAVDGQTVPIDRRFRNGLMYPGDPAAGPEETARCNCDLTYERREAS